jgi:hypothetical protein
MTALRHHASPGPERSFGISSAPIESNAPSHRSIRRGLYGKRQIDTKAGVPIGVFRPGRA